MTLVHNHREISNRMKQLIKSSNKKCYLFVLGPITEAKLGNIVCADIFVYVSCPENALFDRNKDNYLYKKLVTPWELEVALNPLYEWSLNFETNFNELLTVDIEEESEKETKETIPNEINHTEEREKSDTEIIERKPGTLYKLHENGAGQVLQSLSWKGLNPSEESSVPIGTVVEGRSGIAMQYDSEIKYNL
ncbi:Diphthamide biosynthesis protein 2 [Armadillidium vulgare]|nr:Diphthamide biosynthesis protein 2 [Armadillidium vulgare]